MAILKDLIVHGSSRFLNKIYANELEVSAFEAESAIIKKLTAKDTILGNATVIGLLDVQGQLHTNTWTNSNIATIDGCFYITPTLSSDSGNIVFSSTSVASLTGTYTAVTSLYIGDSSSGSTVQWTKDSKVLLTGEVQVNGQWLPLGTLLGTLSANATTSSIGLTGLTDNRHNTSSIITDIRNAVSNASLNYRNLKISLYQRKDGTDSKPLGIYMTAMGTNGKTFIDIYGGVNATTTAGSSGGFADPNLRIGNLSGLGAVEGTTPTGWGIYTTNGYFKGVIVSSAGKIGNFTINSALYSNGHSAWNSNVSGIYINNDGISGGAGGKWWLWNDGSAKIGAMTLSAAGVLTVPAANVSGKLTAATIDGTQITANTITASQIATNAITADELAANAVTSAKIKAGEVKATNIASSAVTADKLDATTINASNKLTVGALTTTDQNNILNSNIQIGGINLLKNSDDLTKWSKESGLTVTWDSIVNMYKVVDTSHTSSKWGIYQDLDIKPNTIYTFSIWGMKSEDTGTASAVGTFASSLSWPSTNSSTYTTTMSRSSVTFTSGADHVKCRVYLYLNPTADNSKTGYFYRPKLEEGNKTTDWSPAPEDIDVHKYITDIDSNKGITVKPADTSGNDYLQMNSSAINFYRNNVETLKIEDSAIRVGKLGNNLRNVYITDSVVQIRNNTSVLAEYGSSIKLYKPGTTTAAVEISSTGATFTGSIVATSLALENGATIGYSSISDPPTIPTTVAELTDSGSYLTTSVASNTYATQTNLNNEINARKAVYGTSSTDAGTATKVVTCSNFALYTGASVTVTFSKANTSSAPQLNINSTGAKSIKSYTGANLTEGEYKWVAGASITFTYDGTNWRMQDGGALQAKIDAASSASTASSQAGVATQQATNATNAKTAAESAKTAAQSAKTAAETAQGAAETASSQASSAKDTAVSAKNDAVSAKTDAETAKGQAQTAAGNASQSATNAANSATAAAEVMGGFTILWNYSAFTSQDNGEGYLCAFDPATGTKSDANGWVKWNGVKRTITKQMINPNTVLPYNIPIYVVCRLSNATATTGTNYMVWYNSGWKYAVMPTPSTVGGSWTWADSTDIILGKFVETASEAALTEYEIYNPPYTSKQITTNVVTAQSASASAASAAQTATTYITNIDSNNGIRIQPANYSTNKDSVQINSTAITMYRNDVDVMSLGDSSFRMGTASGKHTTVDSNGLHIWTGVETTPANEVGLFGSTARIGAPASSRFLLNADSLQAYNSSNVKYFEVSASGLSFGGNAVAKASDIPTTVSQLTDSGNYLTTTVAASTYATQSNFDSLREDFDNYVAPIASKEYLNIIATANNDAKGTFYFGKIKPVDYYTPWKIKYRVQVKVNGITDGYETSDIIISGAKNTYYAYQTYNSITNTSYRPYYYHILYTCTQTGINNGYGHLFGISLRYSYNPTTASNARKINVDVVETEGCTVTLENAPFLYENAAGTGSTNYVNRYSFDGTTQGYTGSGDRNETNHILNNFAGKTGTKGVWGGSLFMKDGDGKYQNICLASDGTATSASSGNGARTTATTKIVNPNGFEIGGNIYYSGSSYNANTNMSSNNVYASYSAFDSRYSINSTLTTNFLTPYAPIYLVGTINQTDNLFYLDSTWWTQTANNVNKVYIYIGNVYDSTTSYCRFSLAEDNTWLVYDGSKLINYQKNESDNAAKTATSYITYVNATDGIKVHNASDTSNYLQLNSSAISMYKSGIRTFNIDNNGYVIVGKVDTNKRNVYITDNAVQIRNNTSVLAEYGSDIILGEVGTNKKNIYISPQTGLDIRNNTTSLANFSDTVRIGMDDGSKIEMTDDSMSILVDGTPLIQMRLNDETMDVAKEDIRRDFQLTQNSFTYSFNHLSELSQSSEIRLRIDFMNSSSNAIVDQAKLNFVYGTQKTSNVNSSPVSFTASYNGIGTIDITNIQVNNPNALTVDKARVRGLYILVKNTASVILGATEKNEQGAFSVTEGYDCAASGKYSHAEGHTTKATQQSSHAEGYLTTASGKYSHAEGSNTIASGECSHTEGGTTRATGFYSHAEGIGCVASGESSHAEGNGCVASGESSHASGRRTIASGNYQTAMGKYNVEDVNNQYAIIVGNGTDEDDSSRSNALTVDWSGNLIASGGAAFNGNASITGSLDITGSITRNNKSLFKKEDVTVTVTYAAGTIGSRAGAISLGTTAKSGYAYLGAYILNNQSTATFSAIIGRNEDTANAYLLVYRATGNAVSDIQVKVRKIWVLNSLVST